MLPFTPHTPPPENPLETGKDIPKDLDIFFRSEEDFLPKGKTFDDLTAEELEQVRREYRFSPYKPGIYQGITGLGKMMF